ncbi:MAG: hypothetical protein ACFBSD_16640 [Paracoccaceae bacterium]
MTLDRRTTLLILHWSTALLAIAVLVASDPGTRAALGGLFVLVGLGFVLRAVILGPQARPGPKLVGGLRWVHLAIHRGLYAIIVLTVATGLPAGLAGEAVAENFGGASQMTRDWHDLAFTALLWTAVAHVLFNAYRETFLGEKVFVRMTSP